MTTAGQRQERITFQQRGLDENGDRLGEWATDGQVKRWARVQPLKGGESVMQQRQQGVAPVIISVLADGSTRQITSAWRAVWKGVPYNLSTPAPDETRAEIAFDAKADQSDA